MWHEILWYSCQSGRSMILTSCIQAQHDAYKFTILFLCQKTHFHLLGKEKIPLGVGYIFESKFPLVVRIGLAARTCGSGNGQSPSNSVLGDMQLPWVYDTHA